MYEALMRAAWSGFETWLTENRENEKRAVDDAFNGLTSLCDNICKAEFQDKLRNQSFSELTQLFDQYMSYLRHENRKLSQFWISYLDMVEILLLSTLDSWINPFEIEQQDVVCLSTGKVATEQIEKDLLQAQDIRERAYCCFSEQRLESNPPRVKFF